MSDETTGAKAIIEFAERRTTPDVVSFPSGTGGAVPLFINGKGEAQSLLALEDERSDHPRRRKGTIQLDTVGSFVDLVNRDKRAESVIFASKGKLVAVLNFHRVDDAPGFCDDRIVYSFPFSDEWRAWTGSNGSKFDQKGFAEFVENRAFDVGIPADAGTITKGWAETLQVRLAGPGELQTLAEGLSVRVEETVENAFRSGSGESTMVHKSEHKDAAGQPLKVPGAFHVRVPIVDGGALYSIPVRLRYRVAGGKVSWFYEMHRPDIFLKHALEDTIKAVKEGCALPVYMGSI
jgi:uncharacterized protein YfdQ (DUF2303 family)